MFIAGFILDWVSIVLICLPIFIPLLAAANIDPIWFAVLMVVVIQTSYLTPPMAPSIFYLRSIAPPEITYSDMYWGVLPFVACQVITLVLVFAWPELGDLVAAGSGFRASSDALQSNCKRRGLVLKKRMFPGASAKWLTRLPDTPKDGGLTGVPDREPIQAANSGHQDPSRGSVSANQASGSR